MKPNKTKCKEPGADESGKCCCNCKNHYQDFHHCITIKRTKPNACMCSTQKGWICIITLDGVQKAHSRWPQHNYCEMHNRL